MNIINWKKRIMSFLCAQTISMFGSAVVQNAIIWYITLKTSSGFMMTLSVLSGYLPQIFVSIFAGAWLDRYNRKKLMMISDGAISAVTLALAILFLFGITQIWLIFVVLAIRSVGTGIQTPAVNSLIPQIVPQDKLMKVNGAYSTINAIMMFLAPAVGGAVLSVATFETTLFIDVITAVIGISMVAFIKIPRIMSNSKTSNWQDIKGGFLYLKKNPLVKWLVLFLLFGMFFVSPSAFLTPLMVNRTFGVEVWRLTINQMAFSVGAIAGGILMSTWGGFKKRIKTFMISSLLYGTLMIMMGVSNIFWVYLIFNFLIGITMPCFNTSVTVLIQENVESAMHGRIFSFVQIANSCALPLGMAFFGPMADIFKVQHLLIIAGGIMAIHTIVMWLFKFRKFKPSGSESLIK